jgi:hypothetical protein
MESGDSGQQPEQAKILGDALLNPVLTWCAVFFYGFLGKEIF